jgi:spore germination protein Q
MNNNYNNAVFPGSPLYNGPHVTPNQQSAPTAQPYDIPFEQSYIENILRLNKGKRVTVYASFADASPEQKSKTFTGIIEQSGRDHLILSNPTTGKWTLILMIYVDYIEFDEKINYSQEFIPNN